MTPENIPGELRLLNQWVVWKYEEVDGRQTKVPYTPDGLYKANSRNAQTWGTFNQAVDTARRGVMNGIGFVFSNADPYTGIDIDNKPEDPASEGELVTHQRILSAFNSYTERSVGGRGYHIIIRGDVRGMGMDRGHVGVYSFGRYFTFTGEVVNPAPIGDYQEYLDSLLAHMQDLGARSNAALVQVDSGKTDEYIYQMACTAHNGGKFQYLWNGYWKELGEYPSQSHADMALMAILAFYSVDNEQCRRLFRMSALAQREKTLKRFDYYTDKMLVRIRGGQLTPADMSNAEANAQAIIAAHQPAPQPEPLIPAPPAPPQPPPIPQPPLIAAASTEDHSGFPAGLVGDVARYIYQSSQRPVHKVALCAALGFMSGVLGRAFNISNSGLNQYILLVAKTGIGKEEGPKGISRLMRAIRTQVPMVDQFIGPGSFASGQGLIRAIDKQHSFVSMLGEFGLTLQAMNDPRAPSNLIILKRVLLDLYSKSGWGNVLQSTAYSDHEKNTKSVHAPNVSFVGDTTPEEFYDSINATDIASGLIPRLHIVEYPGERPNRNRNAYCAPDPMLTNRLMDIVTLSLTMQNNNVCAPIDTSAEALAVLDEFDRECDAAMRDSTAQGERQLWNRCHLKALKLAGVVAVGENAQAPCISLATAQWAIGFVQDSTRAVLQRFFSGDIGTGDAKRLSEMRRVIREYYAAGVRELTLYKVPKELQGAGVIPYSYLLVRCNKLAAFTRDTRGTTNSIKQTLEALVQSEALHEVDAVQARQRFGRTQKLYFVGNLF